MMGNVSTYLVCQSCFARYVVPHALQASFDSYSNSNVFTAEIFERSYLYWVSNGNDYDGSSIAEALS
jgi:hypothetical protein